MCALVFIDVCELWISLGTTRYYNQMSNVYLHLQIVCVYGCFVFFSYSLFSQVHFIPRASLRINTPINTLLNLAARCEASVHICWYNKCRKKSKCGILPASHIIQFQWMNRIWFSNRTVAILTMNARERESVVFKMI